MTYSDCLTLQSALESALLSGSSVASASINNRTITYSTTGQIRTALAEVNRAIQAYERRAANQNPDVRRPNWR